MDDGGHRRGLISRLGVLALVLAAAPACGTEDIELAPASQSGGGCFADGPECNNCIDDDNDGLIDGFDPECLSALDDREDSFDTGIPGDNQDTGTQDCFFDGNSGHGDDGCRMPTCCLLDPAAADCPPAGSTDTCEPSAQCIESCAPVTPPGCDCFGCCTVCYQGECYDVVTQPAVAPDCDLGSLSDPDKCPRCQKSPVCEATCDPQSCILCPGQTEADLPESCDAPKCADGRTVCQVSTDCAGDEFCSHGCCIKVVQ